MWKFVIDILNMKREKWIILRDSLNCDIILMKKNIGMHGITMECKCQIAAVIICNHMKTKGNDLARC